MTQTLYRLVVLLCMLLLSSYSSSSDEKDASNKMAKVMNALVKVVEECNSYALGASIELVSKLAKNGDPETYTEDFKMQLLSDSHLRMANICLDVSAFKLQESKLKKKVE